MSSENGSPYSEEFNPNLWVVQQAKKLSEETGCRIAKGKLMVMSETKDHFNKGTPGDFEKARWFKRIYDKLGHHGIHTRDLHYKFLYVPDDERVTWDDQEYLNTEKFLGKMDEASVVARILKLVPRDAIVDSKAKDPLLYLDKDTSEWAGAVL